MATLKDIDQALLKEFYDKRFKVPGMLDFELISDTDKICIASTMAFAGYRLGMAQNELKKAINEEIERFIKFIISLFKK